jgi:hypothetical protein
LCFCLCVVVGCLRVFCVWLVVCVAGLLVLFVSGVLRGCSCWRGVYKLVFSLCVVVRNPTCTTPSQGLSDWLVFWFALSAGLLVGCASCHKLCGAGWLARNRHVYCAKFCLYPLYKYNVHGETGKSFRVSRRNSAHVRLYPPYLYSQRLLR